MFDAANRIDNGEWEVKTATGEKRVWQFYATPMGHDPDGRRLMISNGIDVTERKLAEERLRESEARYRAIGESIDFGVWMCDTEGKNIYASPSFLEMLGITQEQCSEFGWGNLLHPDESAKTIAAWKECVRTEAIWDWEHRFRGADGQWHNVLARGVPIKDEAGKCLGWAGSTTWNAAIEAAQKPDGMNPMTWLAESAEYGRSHVYSPEVLTAVEAAARGGQKVETIDLSEDYLKAAGQVARKRAAFAAQRLRRVLREGL